MVERKCNEYNWTVKWDMNESSNYLDKNCNILCSIWGMNRGNELYILFYFISFFSPLHVSTEKRRRLQLNHWILNYTVVVYLVCERALGAQKTLRFISAQFVVSFLTVLVALFYRSYFCHLFHFRLYCLFYYCYDYFRLLYSFPFVLCFFPSWLSSFAPVYLYLSPGIIFSSFEYTHDIVLLNTLCIGFQRLTQCGMVCVARWNLFVAANTVRRRKYE